MNTIRPMLLAAMALSAHAGAAEPLVARPAPPPYAQLVAGAGRYRPLQGRAFRFTLGGGDDSPAHARTLAAIALADRGPVHCAVAEWGYSFHHLKGGQVDGAGQKHYGGYPTPPTSRAEAMAVVRRYYLFLRDRALAQATPEQRGCLVSVNGHYCYQHYACEWGCDVVGSEVGENINSIQTHIAFTRGAARQYGKPWLMDFSPWYGPSIVDEDPRRTWGDNSGPTHGHSISLNARTFYCSYMAGANVVVAEGGWLNCFRSQQVGADGTLPLSTLGREAARFYRFTRRHPDRGVPYAPIALILPFDHGIYPGFAPKSTWNAFPYRTGDQRILDTLNAFFPGSLGDPDQPERPDRQLADPSWKDPEYMRTEALRLVASPYGDIVDVLLSNAAPAVLKAYPVAILAGEFGADAALAARLRRYVREGGTLLAHGDTMPPGVAPAGVVRRVLSSSRSCVRTRVGRGAVVVLGPAAPGQPTGRRPLARALERIRRELIPIDVSGRVEVLYNRAPDGWIVTIVNNEGVTKTFREAVRVNPRAEQTVAVSYHGPGRVVRAELWGADSDAAMQPEGIRVSVPPGETRVLRLTLAQ